MRLVTRKEDHRVDEEIFFLKSLVDAQRTEIAQLRAQIDEAREIPPFPFVETTTRKGRVYAMDDKKMIKVQRGEKLDAAETS